MKGFCLCKKIKFSVNAQPAYQLICVCEQCQTIGGGYGFCSFVFPEESVALDEGSAEHLRSFAVDGSEKGVVRQFCGHCGTHVLAQNGAHPVVAVHAGTLIGQLEFKPQVVIFGRSRKTHHAFPAELPVFPEYPPPSQ